jgi:hypothetical protein
MSDIEIAPDVIANPAADGKVMHAFDLSVRKRTTHARIPETVIGNSHPIRQYRWAFAFGAYLLLGCAAEPGISPARGKDQRNDGGGMNTGPWPNPYYK